MKLTKARAVMVEDTAMIGATIDGNAVSLCEDYQKRGLLLQGYVFIGQNPKFQHLRVTVQPNKTYGPDHRMELEGFIHSRPLANLVIKVLVESKDFKEGPIDFEGIVPGGEL